MSTDQETDSKHNAVAEETSERGPADTPADDPSQGPGPRGNQDLDPERQRKVEEDLDRTGN